MNDKPRWDQSFSSGFLKPDTHHRPVSPNPPSCQSPAVDTLSLITNQLCVKSVVSRQSHFTAPWGFEAQGLDCFFYAIQHGQCLIHIADRKDPILLNCGDLIILPQSKPHTLRDRNSNGTKIHKLLTEKELSQKPGLTYGGGGEKTSLVVGGFVFDHDQNWSLIKALPDHIHLSSQSGGSHAWLKNILYLINDEIEQQSPGCQAVTNHLVLIIVIRAIRNYLSSFDKIPGNFLSALSDPDITAALRMIHDQPDRDWSVQKLADEVGMSRSTFAERFRQMVGQSPIAYLHECRMHRAAVMLQNTNESLKTIAKKVGYCSEASFSTAFKRCGGVSPGKYRTKNRSESLLLPKIR
jgi:AraC family transcriptional regulator, alkane utilization regulator